MLSLTCKTAIKAVIYLASRYESGARTGIKEIAEYIDASEHTVGKLLQTLVKRNIINSVKGPSGGFYIAANQLKQPIITIVRAIDGDQVFRECGLGLRQCSETRPCPMHNDYKAAREILEGFFRKNNIRDLCDHVNNGAAYLIS